LLSNYGTSGSQASYTINFDYDPVIFDINKTITLSVPSQTSTRSSTEQPKEVFKDAPKMGGQ
jgi:hypothetical protein